MRVLVVADEFPWPARTGYRIRLAGVLRALAGVAEVDLLSVLPPEDVAAARAQAPQPAVGRVGVVEAPPHPGGRLQLLRRWVTTGHPRALLRRDWGPARDLARQWDGGRYDLVWFSHAATHHELGDLLAGPHVVDLDNLDAFVLGHRRRRGPDVGPRPSRALRARAVRALVRLADGVDERRWRRLTARVVERSKAVVVCSELDRARLGTSKAVVVPNGYDPAGPPVDAAAGEAAGESAGQVPAVALMIGLLTYEPNRDGARWFADQVLPHLRAAVPQAAFRVVGRYLGPGDVAGLADVPGVSVAGAVPDVRPELAAAGVAVVPVRFGGGTRIKILEAFAYGVPVVSTTVGCEGLDVVAGEHLLVADDPHEFAQACAQVLTDAALRARLVGSGRLLWQQRYRWSSVEPVVRSVVTRASAG